jgi:hypothetical protein
MIELDCMEASKWGMKWGGASKCSQLLEGFSNFNLVTEHRPLIPILNDNSLNKLDNPRLLRLRLKMPRQNFTAR